MTQGSHALLWRICTICCEYVGAGKELISQDINFKSDGEVSGCIISATKMERERHCRSGPLALLYVSIRALLALP